MCPPSAFSIKSCHHFLLAPLDFALLLYLVESREKDQKTKVVNPIQGRLKVGSKKQGAQCAPVFNVVLVAC